MTLAPQVDPEKGIVEDLLLYLVADNNQAQYARSFNSFAIWVDNSLDLYKVLTDHASSVDLSGYCDSDQPIDSAYNGTLGQSMHGPGMAMPMLALQL